MMDMLFGDLAPWFTVPALLGTGFLCIQMIAGELGGDGSLDIDLDVDIDADHPGAEFGILSLQSISAFFLGYGWIGLAAYRFLDFGFTGAAAIALLAGIGVAWLMIWLLRSFLKLQNDTNVSITQAEGLVGDVYVQIPPVGAGRGEVRLVINESHHSYPAVQEGAEMITTHTSVRVIRVDTTSNTVVVAPV